MPPRIQTPQGTFLDQYRRGAAWSARATFTAEPQTFGIGFALVSLRPDLMGVPTGWLTKRFRFVSEGFRWLYDLKNHGDYVYAAIFTRTVEGPLLETFGSGDASPYTAKIPLEQQ